MFLNIMFNMVLVDEKQHALAILSKTTLLSQLMPMILKIKYQYFLISIVPERFKPRF